MFTKFIKLALVVTLCVFIGIILHLVIAKSEYAKVNIGYMETGYFVSALLLSRIVRMIAGNRRQAMVRSIYLEYIFSLIYLVFTFFNLSLYAQFNFIIAFAMLFLWHSKILNGHLYLVFLILGTFNAVAHWDRLFYLLLITPCIYLLSLLLRISMDHGLAGALTFVCPDEDQPNYDKERESHLKWWSFLTDNKLLVDPNYDLNLDNVETRNVEKAERESLHDTAFLQLQTPAMLSASLSKIKRRDGMFSYDKFLQRANSAFTKIYQALYNNSIDEIEHLVADALFEQFRFQISEAAHKASRLISVEFAINDLQIAQVNLDNNFDVLHLFARAVSRDYEAGPAEKNLTVADVKANKRKTLHERVICEYWSFIRKPSAQTRDCPGLLEGQCPNCGTPIMIGQATVCPTCSSFIRSGQYDWVLTKITEASAWVYSEPASIPGWQDMVRADSNFSVQQIEERSTSIFWLLRAAEKTRKTAGLRRFAEDEFCKTLVYELENDSFGRYSAIEAAAFDSASLKGVSIGKNLDFCYVLIIWNTFFANKKSATAVKEIRDVLVLSRPHNSATKINNNLSSVHCANCGGPLSSSFEANCTFCGSLVNDGSEWILTRVIKESEPEYVNLVASMVSKTNVKEQPDDAACTQGISGVESATDVITTAAQILMADGKVDPKEMAMIKTIAARYHISDESLQEILDAVRNGMIYVPLPEPKSIGAMRIIREAAKMALADEELSPEEKDAIMNLGMQLGYSKIDIQQIINSELTALTKRLSEEPWYSAGTKNSTDSLKK